MDYNAYRRQFFADPLPAPRFGFYGLHGITLFFADYLAAVKFYTAVLGPPAYVEGSGTRGWVMGNTWLTLLRGGDSAPKNVEVSVVMASTEEAERLQSAFISAGGQGPAPSDALVYAPIRYCPVRDPFGTDILISSPLTKVA